MFEQTFKNIDDILHKDAGCTSELDYTEQSSWLLFLKYLAALETDKATEAELDGKKYKAILDPDYRWENWAAPKTPDGKLDHNTALVGPDLIEFVNGKLFPYLHGFKQRATGPDTIEYKIGEIFGEIKNRIQSGYNLREVIDRVDELRFGTQQEKHELSHLYEAKIKNMGNAGRNGGEYYTPRPLIRAMILVTAPQIGERIYDGAVGSAGFLCEAFDYLSAKPNLSTRDHKTLQTKTFYGKEKKSLAYVIAIMNMILHGIEAPNIVHANTLADNISDIQDKDRYDIVLANPPFGGKERKEVQQNFPIKTGETAFLFLQHFIKILKAGGRGAIVIKNTFLSNTDNASISLRKLLLESCNLHTVLDCPGGTFQGAGVKTVVLFFEKGSPTRKVWYYQLDPGRNMGKTNPLNDKDMAQFVELQKRFADSAQSWCVDVAAISTHNFDLSAKNPNGGDEVVHRNPQDIMDTIAALDAESTEVLATIRKLFDSHPQSLFQCNPQAWEEKPLGEIAEVQSGGTPLISQQEYWGGDIAWYSSGELNSTFTKAPERHISEAGLNNSNSKIFPKGSLLIGMYDTAALKMSVLDRDGAFNQAIAGVKPNEQMEIEFILHAINSKKPQLLLERRGVRQKNLSLGKIKEIAIPVPSRADQLSAITQIRNVFVETQRLEFVYQQKLAALNELKKSLLHQAFRGAL